MDVVIDQQILQHFASGRPLRQLIQPRSNQRIPHMQNPDDACSVATRLTDRQAITCQHPTLFCAVVQSRRLYPTNPSPGQQSYG